MMVLKEKLEISRSSTIVIKEVFTKSARIMSYGITKSGCQLSVAGLNQHRTRKPVADRPQDTATTWQPYTAVGRPVRLEQAHKRRPLDTRSTHSLSPSPTHFASPKHCAELAVRRRSSTIAARRRCSLADQFVSATATPPSPPPPQATSITY